MIKTLVTNIKNNLESRWRFQSPWVLLHGRNGAGKSSLIHGLELACFGQVFDAAGNDCKLKSRIDLMGQHQNKVLTKILVQNKYDTSVYDRDEPAGFVNAVQDTINAMKGGQRLYKFLLEHADKDIPLTVVHQKWEAQVERHGSYRKALLKMDEVVGKALRSHRATIKELDIAAKYAAVNNQELVAQRSAAVLHEAQSKDLSTQIKREMKRFYEEITPTIEAKMEQYIPDGMGKPKFFSGPNPSLGFVDRPVPSGAEMVALAMALAAVVLPMDKSVIIFPDRAYDPVTLGRMMRVARTIPAVGVFVQSTILPESYKPEDMGWHVIPV